MTQFSQLLDDVADEQTHSLASVLMRAKVLSARINSPSFREWVDNELNGYEERDHTPEYRSIKTELVGDFWGPFGAKVQNAPMSTAGLDSKMRGLIEYYYFTENIGSIESLLSTDQEVFHQQWPIEVVEYMRRLPGTRVPTHVLQCLTSRFHRAAVHGVLQAIRSHLLDLLLQLRDEYPELENRDDALSGVSAEVVDRIVQNIIYNQCTVTGATGVSGNNINAGRDINTGRDLVIATSIQDSFNKIENSNASGELQSLLREFVSLIESLHPQLDPDAATELASDGKTLVTEAAKETPRKPILESIGGAIKDTLETLGSVAVPLVKIVDKIIEMAGECA